MNNNELIALSASEVRRQLDRGDLSPLDVFNAVAERIAAVNPIVNALPTLCLEAAHDRAAQLTKDQVPVAKRGALWGLPLAVKDYNDLAGVKTTYGSPIFATNVPNISDATVAQLEAAGAIPVGKANVPEWAGAHTFNPVFGHTLNPWNRNMSAGGSSGGSAVALATGMVFLATGNDLGGSLRVPASFNGVVGLRPSPGRVPRGQRLPSFDTLWVEGPMGRCVEDVALMLDGGAGQHPDDPLSFDSPHRSFREQLGDTGLPKRVAFSPDLGAVPMEPEIATICANAAQRFTELGADVHLVSPDFSGVIDAFQTLRAHLFAGMMEPLLKTHRKLIAPEIIWNIEKGLALSAANVRDAERVRTRITQQMATFFEQYDLLLCPTVSVPPFPRELRYVEEIAGQATDTYIDWIAITFAITMTGCPALSLPVGVTASGLPVGLQVIGRARGEGDLLRACHHMESIFNLTSHVPIHPQAE